VIYFIAVSLSLSLGFHKHRIRIAGKLTIEQRNVKMQATCVTPKYPMVYCWRIADEVQAEEKKTYIWKGEQVFCH
jgi:hypothetical protein